MSALEVSGPPKRRPGLIAWLLCVACAGTIALLAIVAATRATEAATDGIISGQTQSSIQYSQLFSDTLRRLDDATKEIGALRERVIRLETQLENASSAVVKQRQDENERLALRATLRGELARVRLFRTAQVSTEHLYLSNRKILLDAVQFSSADAEVEAVRAQLERTITALPNASTDRYYDIDFSPALQAQYSDLERLIESRIKALGG